MIRKIALTVGGVALAAVGASFLTAQQPDLPAIGDLVPAANAAEVEIKDMTLGNKDAKVQVIEYASYTCSHCATFHDTTFKDLKRDFIDTGKIGFTYREVYWDRYALWAGLVARCGGDMRFFGLTDLILDSQREWSGQPSAAKVADKLRGYGRQAGLSDAQLDACMQDADMAQALVAWSDQNVKADKVKGTPALVINGQPYSNMAYSKLKAILEAELAK